MIIIIRVNCILFLVYLEVLNLAGVEQNSSNFADIIEEIEEKCLFQVFRDGFCLGFTMVLKMVFFTRLVDVFKSCQGLNYFILLGLVLAVKKRFLVNLRFQNPGFELSNFTQFVQGSGFQTLGFQGQRLGFSCSATLLSRFGFSCFGVFEFWELLGLGFQVLGFRVLGTFRFY